MTQNEAVSFNLFSASITQEARVHEASQPENSCLVPGPLDRVHPNLRFCGTYMSAPCGAHKINGGDPHSPVGLGLRKKFRITTQELHRTCRVLHVIGVIAVDVSPFATPSSCGQSSETRVALISLLRAYLRHEIELLVFHYERLGCIVLNWHPL